MRTVTWIKMTAAGLSMCIGGPALIYYVMPSEEELFSRYNPELQRRSLENRQGRQEEFDQFVTRLKQYSKSDKPIWEAQAEAEELAAKARKDKIRDEQSDLAAEVERRRQEMRASTTR